MPIQKVPGVTIYKPRRRSAAHHPWLIAYRDPATGQRVVKATAADEGVAQLAALDVSKRLQMVQCGLLDAAADRARQQGQRPILEHLEEYAQGLRAAGDTQKHLELTRGRVQRVIEAAHAQRLEDLTPATVQGAIAGMYHERLKSTPSLLSPASRNHYLRAVKMFMAWCVREGRIVRSELGKLRPWNAEVDIRRRRRAMSEEELARFLAAVERGGENHGLQGSERACIYRFAVATGLRAAEIRSLTPESFFLQLSPPCCIVRAQYSKHRREDTVVLTADAAEELRPLVMSTEAGKPVFALPIETSRMLMADLKAAGIPYEVAGTYLDFHALRHTAITRVVRAVSNLKVAQSFARHCTVNLTMRYAHATTGDMAEALARVPSLRTAAVSQQTGVQRLAQRGGGMDGQLPAVMMSADEALVAERQTLRT